MNAGNIEIGRRVTLLLAAIMGALLLSSGIALAASITCQTGADCLGTKGKDFIYGRGAATFQGAWANSTICTASLVRTGC